LIFAFNDCELDLDRFELRRAGRLRPVEPQVFDLLAVLIRERHRVVPKEELLDTVWGNRFEQSRLLAALIPNSRLVPLDSSNHLLPEHDPAWKHFLAEIDRFLSALH
jgi:DNA-binding response OmpR family regulator